MTQRRNHRPLLAGATAALGILAGGVLGLYVGLWLGMQRIGPPESDGAALRTLDALGGLVEALPSVLLGALSGAVLGWLVVPSLIGQAMKWPKVWHALGIQIVGGIALWLAAAFIGSAVDMGAVGTWIFLVLVAMGPPGAGRWFVERSMPGQAPKTIGPGPGQNPR